MRPMHALGGVQITEAQRQVLLLLVDGLSNKGIARCLGVSHNTVSDHLKALSAKIDVHYRTKLAVWAVRNGLQ